jgi:hypothetical protein
MSVLEFGPLPSGVQWRSYPLISACDSLRKTAVWDPNALDERH